MMPGRIRRGEDRRLPKKRSAATIRQYLLKRPEILEMEIYGRIDI